MFTVHGVYGFGHREHRERERVHDVHDFVHDVHDFWLDFRARTGGKKKERGREGGGEGENGEVK